MKRLLLKCLLLAGVTFGILLAASHFYTGSVVYQNQVRGGWYDTFAQMPEQIDVAVVGASHGRMSLQTGPQQASFFNFSLSSQVPLYDCRMLREYQSRLHPGSVVVIVVSGIGPFWTDSEEEFQNKQGRYYNILSPENIVDVNRTEYWMQKAFPILFATPADILHAVRNDVEVTNDLEERIHWVATAESTQEDREAAEATSWNQHAKPHFPEGNPVMLAAYREMLTLCREKGFRAILMTPPYLKEYNDGFPPEFYPEMERIMNGLAQEFGVPYYNYAQTPAYYGKYDWFCDSSHLNVDGSAVFAPQFYEDCGMADLLES